MACRYAEAGTLSLLLREGVSICGIFQKKKFKIRLLHPETHVGKLSKTNADYSTAGHKMASGHCLSVGLYLGKRGNMDCNEIVFKLTNLRKEFIGELGTKIWWVDFDVDGLCPPVVLGEAAVTTGLSGDLVKALQECRVVYDAPNVGQFDFFGHDGNGLVAEHMSPVYVDKAAGARRSIHCFSGSSERQTIEC